MLKDARRQPEVRTATTAARPRRRCGSRRELRSGRRRRVAAARAWSRHRRVATGRADGSATRRRSSRRVDRACRARRARAGRRARLSHPPRAARTRRRSLSTDGSPGMPAAAGILGSWHADATLDSPSTIRDIADYPQPGVTFRDITPLLGDAAAFRRAVDELVEPVRRCQRRPRRRRRGPRLHPRRAGRLPHGRRVRPGAQGRQAAVGGGARGVRARVRHRQARDPPRRDPPRRADAGHRRRARHRRHRRGHRPPGRDARRRHRRLGVPDRARPSSVGRASLGEHRVESLARY